MEGRCIQLSLLGEQTKTYLSSIFPERGVFSRIYGVATRNMAQGHAGIREVYILLSFLTSAKDLGFRGACDWVSYVLNLGLLPTRHGTVLCTYFSQQAMEFLGKKLGLFLKEFFYLLQFIPKYRVINKFA